MKKIHLTFFTILTLLVSCSSEQDNSSENNEEYVIEVEDLSLVDSKALYNEIDSLKGKAFSSEESKINTAKNLLKYISKNEVKFDTQKREEAKKAIQKAATSLYTQNDFNNNEKVMKYDQDINNMIISLQALVETVDDIDVQDETEAMVKGISDASARDTFTRGYYNNAVKKWNTMTSDYKDKLQKENPEIEIIEIEYFYGEEPL